MTFSPTDTDVMVGDTVRWTNNDNTTHTVTANNGEFDSGDLDNNDTFDWVFKGPPRQVVYHCSRHGGMVGRVRVA
jgi:plastocyanin